MDGSSQVIIILYDEKQSGEKRDIIFYVNGFWGYDKDDAPVPENAHVNNCTCPFFI